MSCGKLELIAAMSTTTAKSSAVALVACAVVGVLSTLWLTSVSGRSDTTWPSTLHSDVIACEAGTVSAVPNSGAGYDRSSDMRSRGAPTGTTSTVDDFIMQFDYV